MKNQMKKTLVILIIVLLMLPVLSSCRQNNAEVKAETLTAEEEAPAGEETPAGEEETPAVTEETPKAAEKTPEAGSSGFSYVHDPRENPQAMADIIENPEAVYGFSPDPQSTRLGSYAKYDWTDPELVNKGREERIAYHDSMESMIDILYRMRDEGASTEEMARAVSAERNRLRMASYADNPEGLEEAKKSNLETYGHEDGPTPDELYEKYGSWTTVIQKAFSPNLGMDVCCGLYDEYYPLYIELGCAEAD